MFRIAICDDDATYRDTIKKFVLHQKKNNTNVVFYEYSCGEELLCDRRHMHDLLFLDIHMIGIDGNETAKLFRERNEDAVLVICTNYQNPTPESFKVRPFRYIIKDIQNEMLKNDICDILNELSRRKIKSDHYLTITSDGQMNRILIKNILYASRAKRGAEIYVYTGRKSTISVRCRERLEELYDLLKKEGFEYAHHSYIVNFDSIIKIRSQVVTLKNNIELNISRSKKEQLNKRMTNYFRKEFRRI